MKNLEYRQAELAASQTAVDAVSPTVKSGSERSLGAVQSHAAHSSIDPILIAENLRKSFKKSGQVVRDISLSVSAGEIFAFLGPNGAGKTTAIKMVAGLLTPDTGVVRIAGHDPHSGASAMPFLGTVLEGNRNLYWRMTARENLRYFAVHKGLGIKEASVRADKLLDRFGLLAKRHEQVRNLSRGMQQKLAIAVTLIHQPKLLLLDEPTLGLDVAASIQVVEIIRELRDMGMAIVLTTHQLDVAETLADRIAIIRDGTIIKQATKVDLIKEFTFDAYEIELDEDLSAAKREDLLKVFDGARVEKNKVYLPGGSERLYEVLNIIKPAPVNHLGRSKVDLADIFLQLTESGNDHGHS